MKIDFFVGILMVFVGLAIISWVAQPDFALKNPGAANFLGFTSSNVKTADNANTETPANPSKPEVGGPNVQYQNVKIVGASVSFEGTYNQVILRVNQKSKTTNLSQYILKTFSGSFNLPSVNLKAGDYVLITSGISSDGSAARRISSNQYEVFLSQKFLSSGYETAELYNSAGVLVSRYTYGLSAFFQSEFGKEILLSA